MSTTSEKILKNIKESNISPDPKWKFSLKNSIFWFVFWLSLFIGALAIAVILELLINHDWDIYLRLHKTFGQFVLLSFPYLWILILVIFSWIAYFDFVHTRGWYQHSVYLILLVSVISSAGLGMVFFYSGIGKKIDRVFDKKVPFYGMMSIDKKWLWCHPEDGLLGGEIMQAPVDELEVFVVKDCFGNEWEIEMPRPQLHPFVISVGERIKVIGRERDGYKFEAEEFRRW